MRILDKNVDFYDYLQYVYPDNAVTFDRRDSFILTKKDFADHFYMRSRWGVTCKDKYVLLQICNTFWLFLLSITESDNCDKCTEYNIRLLKKWQNYAAERQMIRLSHISIYYTNFYDVFRRRKNGLDEKAINDLKTAVDNGDFEIDYVWNKHYIYKGSGYRDKSKEERHIPILSEIGIAGIVDHLEVYLALDEFLSKEKQDSERTESIGITNDERIVNHGFDIKESFRGKHKESERSK